MYRYGPCRQPSQSFPQGDFFDDDYPFGTVLGIDQVLVLVGQFVFVEVVRQCVRVLPSAARAGLDSCERLLVLPVETLAR
jgi:hypothetical protein